MKHHYLLSLQVPGGYVHSYVIATEDAAVRKATEMMLVKTEEEMGRLPPSAMIVLQTCLDTDRNLLKKVRRHVCKVSPTSKEMLKDVGDFHQTAWAIPASDPSAKWLMDLH